MICWPQQIIENLSSTIFLTSGKSLQRKGLTLMEYTREEAVAKLMSELEKGWKSGEEQGWLSLEEVEAQLGIDRPNAETEAAMLEAEKIARDESVKGYKSMDELFAALKEEWEGNHTMSSFNDFLNEQLKDPEFKAEYDALEDEFSQIQAAIDERLSASDKQ